MDLGKINMGRKIAFRFREGRKIWGLGKRLLEDLQTGKMTGGTIPITTPLKNSTSSLKNSEKKQNMTVHVQMIRPLMIAQIAVHRQYLPLVSTKRRRSIS